ncbi:MAG: hypothetical protein QM817_32845 [Archangium sp.]
MRLPIALLLLAFCACTKPKSEAVQEIEKSQEQMRRLAAELEHVDAGLLPSNVTLDERRRTAPANEGRIRVTLIEAPRFPEDRDVGTPAFTLDADSHWLVRLRIDELLTPDAPFKVGAIEQFIVHSPTHLFGGVQTPGENYTFRVKWERTAKGSLRVTWLELE